MRALWAMALLFTACPARTVPERGVQLVYRKAATASVRSVVDRRLAQLQLRANLQEDEGTLTVRVPEGSDLSRIKSLFSQGGKLEFCGEDLALAARWCDETWPKGITPERANTTCMLRADTRDALQQALPDAGSEVTFAEQPPGAYRVATCASPRIVSAEVHGSPPNITLEFDRAGGKAFAELTRSAVGRRLIIRLDGVVQSAPVVREPIAGGKTMLTFGQLDLEALDVLAASLAGGELPAMKLEREGTWGPPRFK